MNDLLASLSDTALAIWIREGDAFPWIETVHVIAIVTVAGTITIVDLRLLGLAAHKPGVHGLLKELLPWTWAAFLIAAATGTLLFLTNAPAYAHNRSFQLKMVMMALAGFNMGLFNLLTRRTVHRWDEQISPPAAARVAGLLSLMLWITVIFFGRWVGFTMEHFG